MAFDTGNPELTAKDAAAAIGKDRADCYRPTMKPEDEFQVQIKKLGYYTGKALAPFPMYE